MRKYINLPLKDNIYSYFHQQLEKVLDGKGKKYKKTRKYKDIQSVMILANVLF